MAASVGKESTRFVTTPTASTSLPAATQARDGAQNGDGTYAWAKRTPRRPIRSRNGTRRGSGPVGVRGWWPSQSYRHWSSRRSRMLGRVPVLVLLVVLLIEVVVVLVRRLSPALPSPRASRRRKRADPARPQIAAARRRSSRRLLFRLLPPPLPLLLLGWWDCWLSVMVARVHMYCYVVSRYMVPLVMRRRSALLLPAAPARP